MITKTPYGEIEQAFGQMWVRTDRTIDALDTLCDLNDMQSFADDVNVALLDNAGLQVVMQANGWAVAPRGHAAWVVADLIDRAVDALIGDPA